MFGREREQSERKRRELFGRERIVRAPLPFARAVGVDKM
jgi:hypothetical protein